jgi:hypothetical protein
MDGQRGESDTEVPGQGEATGLEDVALLSVRDKIRLYRNKEQT